MVPANFKGYVGRLAKRSVQRFDLLEPYRSWMAATVAGGCVHEVFVTADMEPKMWCETWCEKFRKNEIDLK